MPRKRARSTDVKWDSYGRDDLQSQLQMSAVDREQPPLVVAFRKRGAYLYWKPSDVKGGSSKWDGCLSAVTGVHKSEDPTRQIELLAQTYGVFRFCEHAAPENEPRIPYSLHEKCGTCSSWRESRRRIPHEPIDAWITVSRQADCALRMAARLKRDEEWIPTEAEVNDVFSRPIYAKVHWRERHPDVWKRRCWGALFMLANDWMRLGDATPLVWWQQASERRLLPKFSVSTTMLLGNLGFQLVTAITSEPGQEHKYTYTCDFCGVLFGRNRKYRNDAREYVCESKKCHDDSEARRMARRRMVQ